MKRVWDLFKPAGLKWFQIVQIITNCYMVISSIPEIYCKLEKSPGLSSFKWFKSFRCRTVHISTKGQMASGRQRPALCHWIPVQMALNGSNGWNTFWIIQTVLIITNGLQGHISLDAAPLNIFRFQTGNKNRSAVPTPERENNWDASISPSSVRLTNSMLQSVLKVFVNFTECLTNAFTM